MPRWNLKKTMKPLHDYVLQTERTTRSLRECQSKRDRVQSKDPCTFSTTCGSRASLIPQVREFRSGAICGCWRSIRSLQPHTTSFPVAFIGSKVGDQKLRAFKGTESHVYSWRIAERSGFYRQFCCGLPEKAGVACSAMRNRCEQQSAIGIRQLATTRRF